MNAQEILQSDEFKKIIDFHGHLCPGIAIGYRAAKAGLDWLKENRSEDEEIVAIVENNACGVDAVQVLTGCTFGKGNFIFKDHGKHVFTFFSRGGGKAVRIAMKSTADKGRKVPAEIFDKVKAGTATEDEKKSYADMRMEKTSHILEIPVEELFEITEISNNPPPKAQLKPSVACAVCAEPTMSSKMVETEKGAVCVPCSKDCT